MHPIYISAAEAWKAAESLRARRARFKNYTYGRQWDDPVTLPGGQVMTEREYAMESGKNPLTNNMIRQLVKSVVGRFRDILRNTDHKATPAAMREIRARNLLDELDCRMLEEFLISGCAIQRVSYERRFSPRPAVWIDNVSPGRFFVNRFSDPRGSDIELVGMLHDMSLREVVMRFGRHSTAARVEEIYRRLSSDDCVPSPLPQLGEQASHSFTDAPAGRCRVVEAWALESRSLLRCHDTGEGALFAVPRDDSPKIKRINDRRAADGIAPIAVAPYETLRWHAYFFSPDGQLLHDFESPFPHGSHPFAVKFYPLTDGEVHPFVEDVIDQQRYINRLITLIDHIMSFSAKGVLLFPEDQKPENITWEDIARQWCRSNGILPYKDCGGAEPKQVFSSGSSVGAYDLLSLEMKLFEQISGVSGAIQGRNANPGTAASLYDSQVQNSTIALLDIFDTFRSFRDSRDRLALSTPLQ